MGLRAHSAVRLTAIGLFQVGEKNKAADELRSVLNRVVPLVIVEDVDEVYTQWQLARAWSLLGTLAQDSEAFSLAEKSILRIPEKSLKREGLATLLLDLGWMLRDQERYEDAAKVFKRSLEIDASNVAKIHLAHSLALASHCSESEAIVQQIKTEDLEPGLRLEYLAARGSLAIALGDISLATETITALRSIEDTDSFWASERDKLVIQLMDFVHQPGSTSPKVRQKRIVQILLSINDLLELKPNMFGLGINVNKAIEKLSRRLDTR